MYTVELLPDPALEDGVRLLWSRLHAAGLPSLATHPHPTNRPHLTVLTASSLAGLPPLGLPLAAELGPARLLGRAVVREVTPTPALRDLHGAVWRSLPADRWPDPARWVPHVSLALRVAPGRQQEALALLASLPPARGQFVAARSYDTVARTVTAL